MLQTKGKTILESSPFSFLAEARALSFLILKRDVKEKSFLFHIAELVMKMQSKISILLFGTKWMENTTLVNNSQAIELFLMEKER